MLYWVFLAYVPHKSSDQSDDDDSDEDAGGEPEIERVIWEEKTDDRVRIFEGNLMNWDGRLEPNICSDRSRRLDELGRSTLYGFNDGNDRHFSVRNVAGLGQQVTLGSRVLIQSLAWHHHLYGL